MCVELNGVAFSCLVYGCNVEVFLNVGEVGIPLVKLHRPAVVVGVAAWVCWLLSRLALFDGLCRAVLNAAVCVELNGEAFSCLVYRCNVEVFLNVCEIGIPLVELHRPAVVVRVAARVCRLCCRLALFDGLRRAVLNAAVCIELNCVTCSCLVYGRYFEVFLNVGEVGIPLVKLHCPAVIVGIAARVCRLCCRLALFNGLCGAVLNAAVRVELNCEAFSCLVYRCNVEVFLNVGEICIPLVKLHCPAVIVGVAVGVGGLSCRFALLDFLCAYLLSVMTVEGNGIDGSRLIYRLDGGICLDIAEIGVPAVKYHSSSCRAVNICLCIAFRLGCAVIFFDSLR